MLPLFTMKNKSEQCHFLTDFNVRLQIVQNGVDFRFYRKITIEPAISLTCPDTIQNVAIPKR